MMANEQDEPVTVDEILRRYAEGERDFRGLEIEGGKKSFEGQILDDADFRGAFVVASFRKASLRRANFGPANVKTCDFRGAILCDADFSEAAICGAVFDGADMTGAKFDGADAYGYTFAPGEKPE